MNHRESNTGSLGLSLGYKIGIGCTLNYFWVYTRAIIGNAEQNMVVARGNFNHASFDFD